MKISNILGACILSGVFTLGPTMRAAVVFTVDTDTSALGGNPLGPFSLDFQFTDGSGIGDGNNQVLVNGFSGVSFTGSPVLLAGATASGGTITLKDTGFLNEFTQEFTPGSALHFQVSLTTAVDAGGTPDQFSFAILDKYGNEIPTLGGLGGALITVDLNSNIQPQAFGADPSGGVSIPRPTVAVVPEPALFGFTALLVLSGVAFRRGWNYPGRRTPA
jgi:hypothetical protein